MINSDPTAKVASVLANVPGDPLASLAQADRLWQSIQQGTRPISEVINHSDRCLDQIDWDVIICGGTLGVLIGAALAQRGWRVLLLERGVLRGRSQEWNISRSELDVFLDLGLLTVAELNQAIATEYNPARISFGGGADLWVKDVLNIGVDPVFLLETLKQKFLAAGGVLSEQTPFKQAVVHPNGIAVQAGAQTWTGRLLLDAMGHFSPIVSQTRQGQRPDGICLVVGTCAQGMPDNSSGDLLVSFTPLQRQCQYFWEAFPAREGRTTYLFTYADADPSRPSLTTLFADYLDLLPAYQSVELSQLQILRALFGVFPCYRNSPLQTPWSRILPIGDSSSSQSPLSFGGFGAMVRHLHRLDQGIDQALQADTLSVSALNLLQPYQPNLSVTWLFQRAMSVGVEQKLPPDQINQLLVAVFARMEQLGDPVLRPFLQDVVQFAPLSQTLALVGLRHPILVSKIVAQVGLPPLIDWLYHYVNLGIYAGGNTLAPLLKPWAERLPPQSQYAWQRRLDAWQYGSGGDRHS
ncbi:MAG: FAD-binding oxidoreductase [Aphanocapsa sp. GSE-SYN-MK-11-07L]|jgi:lycopene cyclase CruP|nr:FAD-binding oxidoreductase [Aphanocapsa sp. GSE-SYN-MK-11-07L]